ncbi:lipoprotein signal peptidase, partial [Enterococcus faecium]
VVDFLHVYYQQWHYPVFNIADCAITIGAGLLIWDSFSPDVADDKHK